MVKYIGKINRKGVNELYGKAKVGIVIYQPAANHMEAQPIKMFEYMAAGLPVIASDFPLWKDIVSKAECGICVDPKDTQAVTQACNTLLNDDSSAQTMGKNGRKAIEEIYNWTFEEEKLLDLYKGLEE